MKASVRKLDFFWSDDKLLEGDYAQKGYDPVCSSASSKKQIPRQMTSEEVPVRE